MTLIVMKTLERVYKNYYFIIRGDCFYDVCTWRYSPLNGWLFGVRIGSSGKILICKGGKNDASTCVDDSHLFDYGHSGR